MAVKTINESILTAIADAIRAKLGVQTTYKPSEMAAAIAEIGLAQLESKTITANGLYEPSQGYDGFSDVTVNVPPELTPADEGKVVSNGLLVQQTSVTKTANGTYDTTTNNQVVVSVTPNLQQKTALQNGTIRPDSGYDGLSQVIVNVSGGGGDPRTLLASWDLTGSSPLIDKVGSKVLTNNGVTINSNGAYFPLYSSSGIGQGQKVNLMISITDLLGSGGSLAGKDVEVDVGSWERSSEGGNTYATRLILVTGTNGVAYRKTNSAATCGWSIYDEGWSDNYARSSAIEYSTCKLSFAEGVSDADAFYINNNLVLQNSTGNQLADLAQYLMVGAPTDAGTTSLGTCVGDIYIKAIRLYDRIN